MLADNMHRAIDDCLQFRRWRIAGFIETPSIDTKADHAQHRYYLISETTSKEFHDMNTTYMYNSMLFIHVDAGFMIIKCVHSFRARFRVRVNHLVDVFCEGSMLTEVSRLGRIGAPHLLRLLRRGNFGHLLALEQDYHVWWLQSRHVTVASRGAANSCPRTPCTSRMQMVNLG